MRLGRDVIYLHTGHSANIAPDCLGNPRSRSPATRTYVRGVGACQVSVERSACRTFGIRDGGVTPARSVAVWSAPHHLPRQGRVPNDGMDQNAQDRKGLHRSCAQTRSLDAMHGNTPRSITSAALTFEISLIRAVRMHALGSPTAPAAPTRSPVANLQLNGCSRRATLLTDALRSADEDLRNPFETLASRTGVRTRHRWSVDRTPARRARLTNGRGGGGSRPSSDHGISDPTKPLAAVSMQPPGRLP